MNKIPKYTIFCFLLFLFFCNQIYSQKKLPNFFDDIPNEELAKQIVENMTDEELFAQTLMFSWKRQIPGKTITDWVINTCLGSVKLFGWNTGNSKIVAESVNFLQKQAIQNRFSIPLFVATDQEGGWVRHVKGITSETPGNLALGASGISSDAYYEAYYISKELGALGINLNFAPTVDLLTDKNSTIIASRAFSDDPTIAGILGVSFMKGCQAAGVLTTAKHFPGHGDTSIDSHGRVPEINISKELLQNRELLPFKYLIDGGVNAVMTGHLNFPQIHPRGEPATFSKYIIKELLQKEMGFNGLIITDDIMMTGVLKFAGGLKNAVRMALLAGNNIVESSKTPTKDEAVWTENIKFLKTNPEFKESVKNSAYKIILTKLNYFKGENHIQIFPDPEKVYNKIPDQDGQKFFLNLACRSTTIVRNKNIPYTPKENEDVLLVSKYKDFFSIGKKRFPKAKTSTLNYAIKYAKTANTIIFCLSDKYSLKILQQILNKYPNKKYIIISVLVPAFLNEVTQIKTAIAVYSYSPASLTAAFGALCGDFIPRGKLPIRGIK